MERRTSIISIFFVILDSTKLTAIELQIENKEEKNTEKLTSILVPLQLLLDRNNKEQKARQWCLDIFDELNMKNCWL